MSLHVVYPSMRSTLWRMPTSGEEQYSWLAIWEHNVRLVFLRSRRWRGRAHDVLHFTFAEKHYLGTYVGLIIPDVIQAAVSRDPEVALNRLLDQDSAPNFRHHSGH